MNTDKATSFRMRQVKTTGTSIERKVRSLLKKNGIKFSLKSDKIPGKPDIVLPKYAVVIFVHGCFWHGHKRCLKGRLKPLRNKQFWENKIELNIKRDTKTRRILKKVGWKILTIWECQIKNKKKLLVNVQKIIYGKE